MAPPQLLCSKPDTTSHSQVCPIRTPVCLIRASTHFPQRSWPVQVSGSAEWPQLQRQALLEAKAVERLGLLCQLLHATAAPLLLIYAHFKLAQDSCHRQLCLYLQISMCHPAGSVGSCEHGARCRRSCIRDQWHLRNASPNTTPAISAHDTLSMYPVHSLNHKLSGVLGRRTVPRYCPMQFWTPTLNGIQRVAPLSHFLCAATEGASSHRRGRHSCSHSFAFDRLRYVQIVGLHAGARQSSLKQDASHTLRLRQGTCTLGSWCARHRTACALYLGHGNTPWHLNPTLAYFAAAPILAHSPQCLQAA